jgi:hypothetical protein
VYSTIDYSRFKIIYDFNSLTHLDLFPLPIDERVSLDSNRKIHVVKALHEKVRRKMQKKKNNEKYVFKANKGQKMIIFKLDD